MLRHGHRNYRIAQRAGQSCTVWASTPPVGPLSVFWWITSSTNQTDSFLSSTTRPPSHPPPDRGAFAQVVIILVMFELSKEFRPSCRPVFSPTLPPSRRYALRSLLIGRWYLLTDSLQSPMQWGNHYHYWLYKKHFVQHFFFLLLSCVSVIIFQRVFSVSWGCVLGCHKGLGLM